MARCGCGYNHAGILVNPCAKHAPAHLQSRVRKVRIKKIPLKVTSAKSGSLISSGKGKSK